ncbi:MAG: 30S ribosome-binding factor RbfA, partial [Thermomicrobiales bacterium]
AMLDQRTARLPDCPTARLGKGTMANRRLEQIGDLLRAELSDLLQRELRDPRVGFVTITGVDVSADLRNARVRISCFGEPQEQQESLRALKHASGFLRTEVSKRVRLRTIPALHFMLDHSMAEAEQVQRTLHALQPELAAGAAREVAEPAPGATSDATLDSPPAGERK